MAIRERDGKIHYRETKRTYDTQESGVPAIEVRTVQKLWVFPYAHFLNSCLNPSANLEINFVSYQVTVSGRNLLLLHQALASMSLKMIEVTDTFIQSLEEQDVQIDSINVMPPPAVQNLETDGS